MKDRTYIAIDLKSFYASVECVDRGLDPLTTNLVVADAERTEKTICLAVSPSLKAYGIPGRARLFEVVEKVKQVNATRRFNSPTKNLIGSSVQAAELEQDPTLAVDYIAAPPRMARYMKVSTDIYNIYLRYVAPEDMHVYSVDEVFMDVTDYLNTYGLTPRELAMKMILDVLETTGITATAGIGTNMYLCKIAMDIEAKHIPADENGVRIAELDERSYREKLWDHKPLTDFWRVGPGIAKKLQQHGMYTMGDVARCSIGRDTEYFNEDLLYRLFGINAELLIDHAWGWEPCRISDIKGYKPEGNSISSGQVLMHPYTWDKARLVTREMADLLVLEMVDKKLVTDQMVLTIIYDIDNLKDPERAKAYTGPVTTDRYGRKMPKQAHGSENLGRKTSSTRLIVDAVTRLYERIVDPALLVRKIYVVASRIYPESEETSEEVYEQLDLFTDYDEQEKQREAEEATLERERRLQHAVIDMKKKFGKNIIMKGMNLEEGATARDRNRQIGGHKA